MTEKLITCPRCGSNACSEVSDVAYGNFAIWSCFGCGFTTNSTMTEENIEQAEAVMPELYTALKYKDTEGKYWYPNSVMLDSKAMVFAEGTSVEDWKWSAVQSNDGKADMTTKQEFAERDFMEALDYIGYFN
jgi:hypothetical protein